MAFSFVIGTVQAVGTETLEEARALVDKIVAGTATDEDLALISNTNQVYAELVGDQEL
jgi:hypothetical protein